MLHCFEEVQCMFKLPAPPTSADQGIVGDHVLRKPLLLHGLEDFPCTLWLLPLFASADQGTVGDYAWRKPLLAHSLQELQRLPPLPFS